MEWIKANHSVLSVLVNGGMLLVWIFYAQLLLRDYRRKLRPKVLINQGLGKGVESRCLICNMSEEAIYISLVIVELVVGKEHLRCPITDCGNSNARTFDEASTQGPMHAGSYRDLGPFHPLINRALRSAGKQELDTRQERDLDLKRVSIHLVALYGSEDMAVGASRHFNLEYGNQRYHLQPTAVDTEQLASRREQRKIRQWLTEYL